MPDETKNRPNISILLRNFLVELTIYGVLVVIYFVIVLYLLEDLLTYLFYDNLIAYAVLALVLIVSQGILLESLTSFLLDRVNPDRLK